MNANDATPDWSRWLANFLIDRRRALFLLAAALTALAIGPATRLRFDQSVEAFYAADNPHLLAYQESKRLFGGDEFVVVAFREPELFDAQGRLSADSAARIRELAERLANVPGVAEGSVQHLPDALAAVRFAPLPRLQEQLLDLVRGLLLGDDRRTTAVVVRLMPEGASPTSRARTIAGLRAEAERYPQPTYVVGEPVQIHDTFRYVEQDGSVLGWASSGLLTLVILLIFRRLRWVVLPLLVVGASIVWTKAALVASGLQLSMVSSMLHSLLMVIGVATVRHLIERYREHRQRLATEAAARATFADLGPAIFWTAATTAAGFAAQWTSHVTPVRSFGLMMAIGAMLVPAAVALLAPAGFLWRASESAPIATPPGRLERLLAATSDWVEHHPRRLTAACLAILAISLLGVLRLRLETDFTKNFRDSSPLVESLAFVETQLGGAGVWEVHFPAPERLDAAYLNRVRRLAERLREMRSNDGPRLTKVLALTDGLDLAPFLPLPARRALLRQVQSEFEPSLYNAEAGRMRIVLRARERQPSETKLATIAEVERIARQEFPDARASGVFVLLTFLIESLLSDQWTSFAVGVVTIVVLMSAAFGSWRIGLASLLPNLLPILLVVGAMGWVGLPINLATAMISSVSLGLTIDSSIHYFAGYRRARQAGLEPAAALRETSRGVGRALLYANFALIAGFLVLMLSNFMPLVYFGLLVSVAMLGGLIGNLLLLPLLMRWTNVD